MKIRLAYSPDTDDAFMVYAIKQRKIDWRGFDFEFVSDDIQTLNAAARDGRYEITAISVAAYPALADLYALMPCGASIGQKFGPAVVVEDGSPLTDIEELKGLRVAIPGLQTSAYFSSRCVLPDYQAVPMAFHEIRESLRDRRCDAGILIHELQLNYAQHGLRKIGDLGDLWFRKYGLPLPLGTNAILRSLGRETIAKLNAIYTESIEWALARKSEITREASTLAFAGLSGDLAERYISMYVNEDSLELSADVQAAIALLLEKGQQLGLCRAVEDLWEVGSKT